MQDENKPQKLDDIETIQLKYKNLVDDIRKVRAQKEELCDDILNLRRLNERYLKIIEGLSGARN